MSWEQYKQFFPDNYIPGNPDVNPSSLAYSDLETVVSRINYKARDMEIKSEAYIWDKDNNFRKEIIYDVHSYRSPDNLPAFSSFGARALYEFQERQKRKENKYKNYYYAVDQEKMIDRMWNNNQPFSDIRNVIYESMIILFFNHLQISITSPEDIDLSLYACLYFYSKCFNQEYPHDGEKLVEIYNKHLKEILTVENSPFNKTFISFDFLHFLNELEMIQKSNQEG